jgi:hypothetical protein
MPTAVAPLQTSPQNCSNVLESDVVCGLESDAKPAPFADGQRIPGILRRAKLDIGSLAPAEIRVLRRSSAIGVNGQVVEIVDVSHSSRITGVVPSDLKTAGITKKLTKSVKAGGLGEFLNFGVLKVPMTQKEVEDLARKISEAADSTR